MCRHVFVSQQLEVQAVNSVYLCVFMGGDSGPPPPPKFSQTSQVIPTTSGYISRGRVTSTLFGLVNLKPRRYGAAHRISVPILKIKVSAKLACRGSVCVTSVSQ